MINLIDSELISLKQDIEEMWMLVYNQLDRAGEAILTLDRSLAQQVIACERRVNAFELKIDSMVEDVISLYTPVGVDLRFVLADYILNNPEQTFTCLNLLSIIRKLERAGDHVTNIAEEIVFFVNAKVLKHTKNIPVP